MPLISFYLTLMSPPASAGVLTVAQAGTGDFLELQDAVDAAQEGDTIWVRSGTYLPILVQGKSLHILVLEGSQAETERLYVEGLGFDQVVTITGLDVENSVDALPAEGAVRVLNCEGSVRFQDCEFLAINATGLYVDACEDVSMDSAIVAGGGEFNHHAALWARQSRLAFYHTDVHNTFYEKPGVYLLDSLLYASGGSIRGGRGGDYPWWETSTTSGTGLVAHGASRIIDSSCDIRAGYVGECYGFGCFGSMGHEGPAVELDEDAVLEEYELEVRAWTAPRASLGERELELEWSVRPGDELYVLRSRRGELEPMPEGRGVRLVRQDPLLAVRVGEQGGGETVRITLPLRDLQFGANEGSVLIQSFVRSAQDEVFWLEPRAMTLLDDARVAPFTDVVYVDASAPPGGDGRSWATAYSDLKVALDTLWFSSTNDLRVDREVWVAAGTYRVSPTSGPIRVSFPCRLLGGFAGNETEASQRDAQAHPTVLDGDWLGDDGPGFTHREDNAPQLFYAYGEFLTGPIFVDGITFRGAGTSEPYGPAIQLYNACTLRNCRIIDNESLGAVLYTDTVSLAYSRGLFSCHVAGNRSGFSSIATIEGPARVDSCSFLENSALGSNGVTLLARSQVEVVNSLFAGNEGRLAGAILEGGGWMPSLLLANCTLLDNTALEGPGGLRAEYAALDVRNSILWGNSNLGIVDEAAQLTGMTASDEPWLVQYTALEGWTGALGGPGNHGLDPLLDSAWIPSAGSPCVDAGRREALPLDSVDLDGDGDFTEPLPLDLLGRPRAVDDPLTPDSGPGPAPHVDMGAIERAPGD